MPLNNKALPGIERSRLRENPRWNVHLADVVHRRCEGEHGELPSREVERPPDSDAELRDVARVQPECGVGTLRVRKETFQPRVRDPGRQDSRGLRTSRWAVEE